LRFGVAIVLSQNQVLLDHIENPRNQRSLFKQIVHVRWQKACRLVNNTVLDLKNRSIRLRVKYDAAVTRTNSVQASKNRELFQLFR
jgi:hypothetical protein